MLIQRIEKTDNGASLASVSPHTIMKYFNLSMISDHTLQVHACIHLFIAAYRYYVLTITSIHVK